MTEISRLSPNDSESELARRMRSILDRVAAAAERSGRSAESITTVAVTKYAGMDEIRQLVRLGHRDLGESRIQQLVQRYEMLKEGAIRRDKLSTLTDSAQDAGNHEPIRWHMVGRVQRNKIKKLVGVVDMIHSVESLKLAEALEEAARKDDTEFDVLLQVNVSGEESKQGVPLRAAATLAEQIGQMEGINLRGLMTMAPYSENPESVRDVFRRLREEFDEIRNTRHCGPGFDTLSMGMSGDFEVAIEEGATMVRIGSAFFEESTS
ncbi:MAG: YggS family pyridoxal phosphate-dependent enzyme [Phycisphaeraceae bacterium]|nr:YggS family pyridoxal phosphate-dependent enzyme [Phycisphaeraceae bacterium]